MEINLSSIYSNLEESFILNLKELKELCEQVWQLHCSTFPSQSSKVFKTKQNLFQFLRAILTLTEIRNGCFLPEAKDLHYLPSLASKKQWISFFQVLYQTPSLQKYLNWKEFKVLQIEDMIFLINLKTLKKRLEELIEREENQFPSNFPIYIDINEKLKTPKQMPQNSFEETNLKKFLKHLNQSFNYYSNDTSNLVENSYSCWLDIPFEESLIYLPCLCGWLLEYPFIYSNSQFEIAKTSQLSNCLTLIPLQVFRIAIKYSEDSSFQYSYSFSVPQVCSSSIDKVCEWLASNIRKRIESQITQVIENKFPKLIKWNTIKIQVDNITLSHVLL